MRRGLIALLLLSRRQARLLYRSPAVAAWYAVLPLLLIVAVMPVMDAIVADGASQAIPGFTLLFSSFLATTRAGRIVRDRQSGVQRWRTATPTPTPVIVLAPALAVASLGILQVAVALLFGNVVYGLDVDRIGLFAFLAVPVGAGLLLASLTDDLALQANIANPD